MTKEEEFELDDKYAERFGELVPRGYRGTWKSEDEMLKQMKQALKTGKPVKLVKLEESHEVENPYSSMSWRNEPLGEALYAYWEKFHRAFPIGHGSPYTTDEDMINAAKEAVKTGKPVEPYPYNPDVVR